MPNKKYVMARRVALSVHLIAAVSAELACEAHPDCASCTSDPPCGWCSGRHFRLEDETMVKVETAHCTEGTANGPITQFCENFQFSACATPETDVVRPCEGALPRAPTPIHTNTAHLLHTRSRPWHRLPVLRRVRRR